VCGGWVCWGCMLRGAEAVYFGYGWDISLPVLRRETTRRLRGRGRVLWVWLGHKQKKIFLT